MTRVRVKGKKTSMLNIASVSMTIVIILSLLSAWATNNPPQVSFQSPTATHSGYFAVNYTGVYHFVYAQQTCAQSFLPCLVPGSEVVFYLTTENATIRLVFYCGVGYCWRAQQLPFTEGDEIHVEGTLIQPSDWPTNEYQPTLQFFADLYVFNYTTA